MEPFPLELVSPETIKRLEELEFQTKPQLQGIFILDRRGNFLEASQTLCNMLSYQIDELIHLSYLDIIHPDDQKAYENAFERILKKEVYQCQLNQTLVSKNQNFVAVNLNIHLLQSYDLDSKKLVCTFELASSNYFFKEMKYDETYLLMFANNPHPMWIYDLETSKFLAVNSSVILHYGYSQNEFLAMTVEQICVPEDDRELIHPIIRINERPTESRVCRHYKKDRSLIYVEVTSRPIVFNGRQAEIVLANDITEQKATEIALRRAEEKYRSIFENAVEGIFQTSADGRYLTINPMLAYIYGYESPEELMNSVVDIANQLYVKPERRLEFMKLLESKNAVNRFESQVYRKDRSVIWISENARTIRDRHGKRIGYEGTVEDITEYKRAEEELKLLQRLTLAISESKDFYSAIGIALQQICEATGWVFGEAWISNQQSDKLECCPTWYTNDESLIEFRKLSENVELYAHEGLAGRVWQSKQPEWLEDISEEVNSSIFLRHKTAIRFGLKAALGIPILSGDEVVAVMAFFLKESRSEDRRLINLVSTIAAQLGTLMQRKRAQEALRQSEERFRLIIENAMIGMNVLSIEGKFLQVNSKMCEIIGFSNDELLRMSYPDITHPGDLATDIELTQKVVAGEIAKFQIEKRMIRKDSKVINIRLDVSIARDSQGTPVLIVQVEDITDRNLAEARIKHLAFHDSLTSLPNRALFKDKLNQALNDIKLSRLKRIGIKSDADSSESPLLAVIFLDLDRFKIVNDTLGHAMGDHLLQKVTKRLAESIQGPNTLARLGGDEFMILLPEISCRDEAVKLTQKLVKSFELPFYLDKQEIHITTSIGISFYPHDGGDAETLLKNADTAMFRAKEQGRNHYCLYARTMNAKVFENMALENRLRKAITQQEFRVYYQPQVDLQSGQIIGLEALVRWLHPELGLISPAQFIPIAEEHGLIVSLGEWVLRTACWQNKTWQNAGLFPVRIAVNISARQLQDPNLVGKVNQILSETQLDPKYLELEITESVVMKDESAVISTLHQLKGTGIQISIDDFGTGYSSLSHLKQFPVEKIKIDASFVRHITTDSDDAAITKAIIAMAHSLKLKAIAEGVETQGQLQFLKSLNCDAMQGYLFSPPLPADEIIKILTE